MNALLRDLRNVEWELYLLYRRGEGDSALVAELWAEVERLDALIAAGIHHGD